MKNSKYEYAKIIFLENCRFWPKAVILQGNRLLEISETLSNLNSKLIIEFDDSRRCKLSNEIEEYNFNLHLYDENTLIAMNRAIFFLDKAADYFEVFRKIKNDIDEKIGKGYVKEVRGMRTHIDEYVKGKGNLKEKFIHVSPNGSYVSDAESSLVIAGEYMIGGRINVRESILLFKQYKPQIDELCQKYLSEIFST